jgi:SlyX protein
MRRPGCAIIAASSQSHRRTALTTEDRLVELEIKLTRQEDLVESLNRMVYLQQKKIDELEALCSALARHVREARDAAQSGPANEKPPHY